MIAYKPFLSVLGRLSMLAVVFALAGCSLLPGQSRPVSVKIAYRNHPPVRAVLEDVDRLLAKYDKQLTIARYDVDTPDGESFLKNQKIMDPTVLAIFIGDSMMYQQDGRQVQFFSFPQGSGTEMTMAGDWTLEDLDAALGQATESRK